MAIIMLCSVIIFTSLPFTAVAESEYENVEYVPGEIVITTTDELIDTSSTFLTYSDDDYTLINFEEEDINCAEEVNTFNETSSEKTYKLEVDGDVLDKCKDLESLPGVKYAEPNLLFETYSFFTPGEVTIPTDTYKDSQKWYFDLMQIPDAWKEYETTGENVIVAVIDNGFDVNAYEFPTNLWSDSNGNHGWNTAENSADIGPVFRSDGTFFGNTEHGTHVASIIGMQSNNFSAIGAAYNAKLMLIKVAKYVSDSQNAQMTLTSIVSAIKYAQNNGADIINMSIGLLGGASSLLRDTINNAYNNGVAIIAAAGNESVSSENETSIPASYANVIGVMAGDKTDPTQLAFFSNYDPSGQYYDVVAPGYGIIGSITQQQGKLRGLSGTSQAAPLVASLAALYLSAYPDATVSELYEAIRKSPTALIYPNKTEVSNATYKFKLANALELLNYGKIKPEIIFNTDTAVTRDKTNGYIYNLSEGYKMINDFVTVAQGTGTMEVIPTSNGNGTGTQINIYTIYGELYETYRIIIFGDTNGDCYADGQDAVITSWIIDSPDNFPDYLKFAADVDFSDSVDQYDYDITAKYAVGTDYVFQMR